MNSFADRLNVALSQKGISQAELSRRTGIGRNSISDYLKAKYEAKQDNLMLLANALDVNEAWLMGLDVEMEKTSITSIYNKLNLERQKKVLNFAKQELVDQNKKIVSYPEREIDTLAAHRVDETATASPEDKAKLHSKLDEMDRKFDEQQRRLKAAEEAKRGGSDE